MTTVTSLLRIYPHEHRSKPKELTERADLLGERKVLIEAKTGQDIDSAPEKQLRDYVRATEIELGRLFKFRATTQLGRYRFENDGKKLRNPRESMDQTSPGSCR